MSDLFLFEAGDYYGPCDIDGPIPDMAGESLTLESLDPQNPAVFHNDERPFYEGDFEFPSTLPDEVSREDDWIPQVVAGTEVTVQYSDEDTVTFGAEYFFNSHLSMYFNARYNFVNDDLVVNVSGYSQQVTAVYDSLQDTLPFCTEHARHGCCEAADAEAIRRTVDALVSERDCPVCYELVRAFKCAECSPHAGRFHVGKNAQIRLCRDYCERFFEAWIGPRQDRGVGDLRSQLLEALCHLGQLGQDALPQETAHDNNGSAPPSRVYPASGLVSTLVSALVSVFASASPSPFLAYRLRNLSTRPAVSTNFWEPVKKGWHAEQISTL